MKLSRFLRRIAAASSTRVTAILARRPDRSILMWLCLAGVPPAIAQIPGDLDLELVITGLTRPVLMTHAGDGSGRLFLVEQGGDIKIWNGSQTLGTPFLDITALLSATTGEQGLLGLAFHPDYSQNGYFFVNYTEPTTAPPNCPPGASCTRNTVIARYQVSAGDPNVADPNSALRILTINQDYANHNGGNIQFGPDAYLYVGMGDGGSGGDPQNRAQALDTLLGKVLRLDIDIDGSGDPADCDPAGNYEVPTSNPFVGVGGACAEIWDLGLRNPWRWSFDRWTGDLFIGDVGQNSWEEIDFEPWSSAGGLNYGWRCYEGDHEFNTSGCGAPGLYTFPIFEYDQSSGGPNPARCAVTGGYVYRGHAIFDLQGLYLFGDYCTGEIWYSTADGLGWNTQFWQETGYSISTFGEDERGELYLTDFFAGQIYRFVSPSSIFGDGFESGDLAAWTVFPP